MNKKVRIGIIGCGGIANGKHLPSLSTVEDVELVAFCDLIPERAEAAKEKYGTPGAKVFTDYKELLKLSDIDVVHVLTPNREHADITIDALRAGKDVMCEKPMAKTAADAYRMCEAAKETGRKLTIGYQHRHKPEAVCAKQAIESGELGEIYYAKCYAIRRRATPNWGVFLNEEEQGGGPVIDIATHSLDLTLYLMDNWEPQMVVGKTHKMLENPEEANSWGPDGVKETSLEESACAFVLMKNGATILVETSWALNTTDVIEEGSCVLCGSKGGLSIINNKLSFNTVKYGRTFDTGVCTRFGGVAFYAGKACTPQQTEAERWIDAVKNDKKPVVLPEQALVVSQILEAIYTSSKTGKPVYFD